MAEPGRSAAAPARWNDLGRRVASALVLAPVALFCVWQGGPLYNGLILVAAIGLALEWGALCGATPSRVQGAMVGLVVVLGAAATLAGAVDSGLIALAAGGVLVWLLTRRPLLAIGTLYVGLPVVALLWLRAQPGGREAVLFLIAVIWASDIGAYLVGRTVGGPKLAPALSPGKTWSGALGGLVAVSLIALAMPPHRWGLALLLGVMCQAGDLLESGIKRHVGVKDSGHLIPGHGGLLDRLDGLMAAAPVAALVMLWSRGGLG